jgi:hypothetical protein
MSVPSDVGRDRSFPTVLGVDWHPNRATRLNAFAGAVLFGVLEILESNANRLARRRVDPVLGANFSISF